MSMASLSNESVPDARTPATGYPLPPTHALPRILIALVALLVVVMLVLLVTLWQKVTGMQEQLARQSADALAQSTEARTLAREASETVRGTAARLTLAETRIGEVVLQRSQLEDLMQNLSRSRDENLVVEVDSALRLALQQAQATGNVEPLLAALRSAEQRVGRAAQPRLAPLARAIAGDADRIRASAAGGRGEALQKLDDLIRLIDDLPARNAVGRRDMAGQSGSTDAPTADAPWWERLLWAIQREARSLVRVARIDQPEAALVAPEQEFYLRENLKLRLLHARLALLSRQIDTARGELGAVTNAINRYFDPASRRTQAAATLLQQLYAQIKSAEAPRIDDTLAALATAAAGR